MDNPSIKKNVIISTLYQILSVITPLITAPYISRVIGADGIGEYTNELDLPKKSTSFFYIHSCTRNFSKTIFGCSQCRK